MHSYLSLVVSSHNLQTSRASLPCNHSAKMAGFASKTYNPSEQAPFKIGMASSGRSKCRNPSCKEKIKKGELRIARMEKSPTEALNQRTFGKLLPKWVHMRCCAPVILREAVDRYGDIEGVPGYDELMASMMCQEPKVEAKALTQSILQVGIIKKKDDGAKEKVAKRATTSKRRPRRRSSPPRRRRRQLSISARLCECPYMH